MHDISRNSGQREAAGLPAPPPALGQFLNRCLTTYAAENSGAVANYIPELSKANPAHFGIALATIDGHVYEAGDSAVEFTIQSISKAFVFALALDIAGAEKVEAKIGVEPSGEAFNSIRLTADNRPFNADGQRRRDRLLGPDPRRRRRRRLRARARRARPLRRPRTRRRRGGVPVRALDRRPQPRHRLHAAQLFRGGRQCRRGARRLLPPMLDFGDGARSRGHGGDARQSRRQSDQQAAGRLALRRRPHAVGDDLARACTTTPANGSTASASRPRAASAAASSPRCRGRSGSAPSRRCSTATATACAASRCARLCRRISSCTCSTARTTCARR